MVCLRHQLHIHDMRTLKILHSIMEMPSNAEGLFALTGENARHGLVAYPGHATVGDLIVFNTETLVNNNNDNNEEAREHHDAAFALFFNL